MAKTGIRIHRRRRQYSPTRGLKGGVSQIQKVANDVVKQTRKAIGTKGGVAILGGTAGLVMGATLAGLAGIAMTNQRMKKVTNTARHAADILEQEAHELKEATETKK